MLQFQALPDNHQIYLYSYYVEDFPISWVILLSEVCIYLNLGE